MDAPAGGEGGDVDAFDLAGDGVDMGGGGGDDYDFGGGGYEADPNVDGDVGPEMQVGEGSGAA